MDLVISPRVLRERFLDDEWPDFVPAVAFSSVSVTEDVCAVDRETDVMKGWGSGVVF